MFSLAQLRHLYAEFISICCYSNSCISPYMGRRGGLILSLTQFPLCMHTLSSFTTILIVAPHPTPPNVCVLGFQYLVLFRFSFSYRAYLILLLFQWLSLIYRDGDTNAQSCVGFPLVCRAYLILQFFQQCSHSLYEGGWGMGADTQSH